jgi:predicted ATP-grasp superfamily ATP-dependent carboligase
MPRVFIYEYCCAVGLGHDPSDSAHALYREGRAMRQALERDFAAAAFTVFTWTSSVPIDDAHIIRTMLGMVDSAVIIAPEFEGILESRSALVPEVKRLGPTREALRLTADKLALFQHWLRHGVPTPETRPVKDWPPNRFPVVLKPRDGVGSTATSLIRSATEFEASLRAARGEYAGDFLVQDFHPGRAASVAFLIGPKQTFPLLPAWQHLSEDGRFHYRGGALPLATEFADRTLRIATAAVKCVPGLRGYVGVDVILGDAADGRDDVAIEINPRLTTSFVGLQALAGPGEIARRWNRLARGEFATPIAWGRGTATWTPDGRVAVRRSRGEIESPGNSTGIGESAW